MIVLQFAGLLYTYNTLKYVLHMTSNNTTHISTHNRRPTASYGSPVMSIMERMTALYRDSTVLIGPILSTISDWIVSSSDEIS